MPPVYIEIERENHEGIVVAVQLDTFGRPFGIVESDVVRYDDEGNEAGLLFRKDERIELTRKECEEALIEIDAQQKEVVDDYGWGRYGIRHEEALAV